MKILAGELAFTVDLPGFQLQLAFDQELAETIRSKICLFDPMTLCVRVCLLYKGHPSH